MIKECNIISNNGLNMVINYDGKIIQMPSIHIHNSTCFVKYDKGFYSVVSREDYEKQNNAKKQKKRETAHANSVESEKTVDVECEENMSEEIK